MPWILQWCSQAVEEYNLSPHHKDWRNFAVLLLIMFLWLIHWWAQWKLPNCCLVAAFSSLCLYRLIPMEKSLHLHLSCLCFNTCLMGLQTLYVRHREMWVMGGGDDVSSSLARSKLWGTRGYWGEMAFPFLGMLVIKGRICPSQTVILQFGQNVEFLGAHWYILL